MKKVAILILMHEETYEAALLIKRLSQDFDLFIHIDKKSSLKTSFIDNYPNKERIHVYKEYKVYWGSFNQI